MDLSSLKETLLKDRRLASLERDLGSDSFSVEALWSSPKALLLYLAHRATKKRLLILTEDRSDNHLVEDLAFFFEQKAVIFPSWDNLPEEMPSNSDIAGERFQALKEIHNGKPQVIVTSLKSAFEKVVAPHALEALFIDLKVGDEVGFKKMQERLISFGYRQASVASEKGSFAVRGGIIDLFASSAKEPYRFEFFEDEIASIRTFDPASQLSTGRIQSVTLAPSEERRFLEMKGKEGSLFDYLSDDVILVFDELYKLEEHFTTLGLAKAHPFFYSKEEFFTLTEHLQKIFFIDEPLENLSEVKVVKEDQEKPLIGKRLSFEAFGLPFTARRMRSPFVALYSGFCPPETPIDRFQEKELLQEMAQRPLTICFVENSDSDREFIDERLAELENPKATLERARGYLSSGFFLQEIHFALVPASELTHRQFVRRDARRTLHQSHANVPSELFALTPGEAVVHMNSGIGRYLGIERKKNHLGVETEFLILEYAEGSKLYVPVENAALVSKYIGASVEAPDFHTLGSSRWKKSLERSERAIFDYASDLLELEAERATRKGFAFGSDSELTRQFAREFPYQETPDQHDAIQKVFVDMQAPKPMDRLVCGDVGFGKTEVAMRAAFKAVVDGGKQVAVLVPTTVLAAQHFETFSLRMKGFPIRIAMLSRFRSPKEIKQTLVDLAEGKIDIVIGTHRLASKDVAFRDLGLVIVDEEQRFGVKTKEHLKKLKAEVDCLALSATPIPRTLYFSLVGARDMSVINTPPLERLPIQTAISESKDEIFRSALLRELARDGQAFVIHNRIETIYELASRIQTLVPEARVVVGHGGMSGDELDTLFHAFKMGQAQILVATAIIENGIDIPNANTILVDRADQFGLADLYQMRGRVGRWNRKAYCYFLVRDLRSLSEISKRRLSAIASAPGFGGGMKVALFDLEIRGAGNILGTEQSGHISSIGFSLYCKLLKRAVAKLKKKEQPVLLTETKVDFPFDARIPDDYVSELNLRLELYGRIGELESGEEMVEFKKELLDRFGALPDQVQWLLAIAEIKLFSQQNRFTSLKIAHGQLEAEQSFGPKKKIQKKLPLPPLKSPQILSEKVVSILKENFPIS